MVRARSILHAKAAARVLGWRQGGVVRCKQKPMRLLAGTRMRMQIWTMLLRRGDYFESGWPIEGDCAEYVQERGFMGLDVSDAVRRSQTNAQSSRTRYRLHKARVCMEAADPTAQREPDGRRAAQPRTTDTDRLRVVNCAAITSWRGSASAEMLRLKQPARAGVVSADRSPATPLCRFEDGSPPWL